MAAAETRSGLSGDGQSALTKWPAGDPTGEVPGQLAVHVPSILPTMPSEFVRLSFRRHMREQVLNAARALAIEKGWERVRVSEVAELAGVSRPTLYKEFTDKKGLGDALIVREGEEFLDGVRAVLDKHTRDAGAGIIAAVRYTLDEAESSPLLKAVLTANRGADVGPGPHDTGVLPLLPTSASLLELSSATMTTWFIGHFPGLDAQDVRDVVDALVRLTVSHLVLPSDDAAATAQRISQVALRYLRLDHPSPAVTESAELS